MIDIYLQKTLKKNHNYFFVFFIFILTAFSISCANFDSNPDPTPTNIPFSKEADRVLSLSISPDFYSDKTIFAGTEKAGIFRSTDSGTTWKQTNNGITDNDVLTTVVSPNFKNDKTKPNMSPKVAEEIAKKIIEDAKMHRKSRGEDKD